jgi:hypothetical protein
MIYNFLANTAFEEDNTKIKIQHPPLPTIWIVPPYFELSELYTHIAGSICFFFQRTTDR